MDLMFTHGTVGTVGIWLQAADGVSVASTSDAHLTMIFTGIIAICVLLVVLSLVGVAIFVMTLRKKAEIAINKALQKANPVIAEATGLLHEAAPHIRKITANVSAISDTVKGKVDQFGGTLTEVNDRTKSQVARVDGMVSDALTTTSDIASTIHRGIRAPIREVAGVVAAVKAAMDVLVGRDVVTSTHTSTGTVTPITQRSEPVSGATTGRGYGI